MTQPETKTKDKKTVTLTFSRGQLAGYSLALLGLMVWLFILGLLVGRGDINYWLKRWDLESGALAARFGFGPKPPPPVEPLVGQDPKPEPAEARATATESPTSQGKPLEAPLTPASSVAALTPATSAKTGSKESKKAADKKPESPTSVASKLDFQNNQDRLLSRSGKGAKKPLGGHEADLASLPTKPKAAASSTPSRPPAYQVRVGEPLREPQQAQKLVADLKKKGVPVTLQQKKDSKGTLYVITTNRLSSKQEAEKIAQKLRAEKYQGHLETLRP